MSSLTSPIVVTGMGIMSAAGCNQRDLVTSLHNRAPCVKPITSFDTDGMAMNHAGEIPLFAACDLLPPVQLRTVDRGSQLALAAARQALHQAGLNNHGAIPGVGVAIGVSGAQQYQNLPITPRCRYPISRRMALYSSRNTPTFQADLLARSFALDGPRIAFGSASLGGLLALSHAMDLLTAGHAPAMLVGGGEIQTLLNALGMDMLGMSADGPCTPFTGAPGMCFGDAAAFVFLESLHHAEQRKVPALGELVSCGVSADAYDSISNDPSGQGLQRAIRKALVKEGISTQNIAWIRACGSGHREQDVAESIALNSCFEGSLPPVTSTEPYFGHVNGVSPILGVVAALTAQNKDFAPAMPDGGQCRRACDLPFLAPGPIPHGDWLLTAMAFGGSNGALIGGAVKPQRSRRYSKADVIVGGIGVVSPLGADLEQFIDGMQASAWGNHAELRQGALRVDESTLPSIIQGIRLNRRERLVRWALVAAAQALGNRDSYRRNSDRIGLLLGLTRGPATPAELFFNHILNGEFNATTSRSMLRMSRFSVASELVHEFGLQGYSGVVCPGVHGGTQLLAHGAELLRASTDLDALLVVGADEWSDLKAALYRRLGLIDAPARPYEPGARGAVAGEGAAALLLLRQEPNSGDTGWGRISGCGFSGDTGIRPDPLGRSYARAMSHALERAGKEAAAIGFIIGQGCGWPEHDRRELSAIATVGNHATLTSVLAHTGMAECAGGLFGAISALVAMDRGWLPPLARKGLPVGDADFVLQEPRTGKFRSALLVGSNERGSHGAVVMETEC